MRQGKKKQGQCVLKEKKVRERGERVEEIISEGTIKIKRVF